MTVEAIELSDNEEDELQVVNVVSRSPGAGVASRVKSRRLSLGKRKSYGGAAAAAAAAEPALERTRSSSKKAKIEQEQKNPKEAQVSAKHRVKDNDDEVKPAKRVTPAKSGAKRVKLEVKATKRGTTTKRKIKRTTPVVASPPKVEDDDFAEEPVNSDNPEDEDEDVKDDIIPEASSKRKTDKYLHVEAIFWGKPVPKAEAKRKWPKRFDQEENRISEHYERARVDGVYYDIGDCVSVHGEQSDDYFGKIMEFFKSSNREIMFRIQWFYKYEETSIGRLENVPIDSREIFASEDENDILLECITGKIHVCKIDASEHFHDKAVTLQSPYEYYYTMRYSTHLSTFQKPADVETPSISDDRTSGQKSGSKAELSVLDLYSGCGGMSTGLSMGGALAGANFLVRWTVDINDQACKSLKHNHPEAEVHEMDAESFLLTLKEWQKLCEKYDDAPEEDEEEASSEDDSDGETDGYEVEKLVGFRMAAQNEAPKKPLTSSKGCDKPPKWRLEFKVRWKGYSDVHDSWEPMENLEDCQGRIREFVLEGRRKRIYPLPGDVDIICGGPPCQGASGFNRFRNKEAPLECPRNRQIKIYMNIVEFLKPRFVLMENVVDILKFANGILGRYAMFRLVNMHYQAKLGLMAAGSYGLPQFRMRVFLWGASPNEKLPSFPLPTHAVLGRGVIPTQFMINVVKHEDDVKLETHLVLEDAISDLPPVGNYETRNEMKYGQQPKTSFQKYIRSAKGVFYKQNCKEKTNGVLHDHRPLKLNEDDYQRACRIPKRKGANFRDLGGLRLGDGNTIELDPNVEREYLPSGKPLVPDYAISFVAGKSTKPFARLWWDDIVMTVVTRAEPHNQRMLHPVQDRVLTIRENARLQGFPDWYKLSGTVKERYTQVGNAVAVPVARALGYSLGMAVVQGVDSPVLQLPKGFPNL